MKKKPFDDDLEDDEFDDDLETEIEDNFLEDDQENIIFEQQIYQVISKTNKIYIVPFPDSEGRYLKTKELNSIRKYCSKEKLKILFRVSHGKTATLLDSETHLTGLIPNIDVYGFFC